jgi:glutaconyl-CoA/methylmalonyl-CoA decarboxylase subunit gamma
VPAKLCVTIVATSGAVEHVLELREATAGQRASEFGYVLDDEESGQASCAQVEQGLYSILLGGRSYEARVTPVGGSASARYNVRVGAEHYQVTIRDPRVRRRSSNGAISAGPLEITAPMPGRVVKVLVQEGQEVTAGQGVLVIEAMKMQNELRAPRAGCVERIHTVEGEGVETGAPLLRLA